MQALHAAFLISSLGGIIAAWCAIDGGPLLRHREAAAVASTSSPMPPGIDTAQNYDDLAVVLMSEASIGTDVERKGVGWTVINRMTRNKTSSVQAVLDGAYSREQKTPAPFIKTLAIDILQGQVPDPTNGCTHFYTPRRMPMEGDADLNGRDVRGGLEQVPGLPKRNYRPGWAVTYAYQSISGVRPTYYKFYRAPGNGPVR